MESLAGDNETVSCMRTRQLSSANLLTRRMILMGEEGLVILYGAIC